MSERADPPPAASTRPSTAGGLLRQARQAQGLHIAALAAAIKVVPRKLELLESDQYDQLPDATFTRALAQAVCRTLKVDAAPVLALLPPLNGHRLEQVAEGLNTPFHERPGRLVPKEWARVASPILWVVLAIGVLTLAVYALPTRWMPFAGTAVTRPRADEPPSRSASAAETVAQDVVAAPSVAVPASESSPAASASSEAVPSPAALSEPPAASAAATPGLLRLHATASSWVEVIDARGQSLIARLLQPGESVDLDGALPLKVRIGNVAATQLVFRGQPLALAGRTRDNVLRLELK